MIPDPQHQSTHGIELAHRIRKKQFSFGCGRYRNFGSLKQIWERVLAYHITERSQTCRSGAELCRGAILKPPNAPIAARPAWWATAGHERWITKRREAIGRGCDLSGSFVAHGAPLPQYLVQKTLPAILRSNGMRIRSRDSRKEQSRRDTTDTTDDEDADQD